MGTIFNLMKHRPYSFIRSRALLKNVSIMLLAATGLILSLSLPVPAADLLNGTHLPFYVYHGSGSRDNHYVPSGWMGDYGDLHVDEKFHEKKNDPKTVVRVDYNAKGAQGAGWAGIYWQHPANNWGNREGGMNLNGAHRLVFLARGAKGGEKISEFKVGGIEGTFRDSGSAAIGPLELTKKWQEYSIPLDGQELSSIAGGFCLTMSRDNNPEGMSVYLDNIRFE
jgi:hypothetical protein